MYNDGDYLVSRTILTPVHTGVTYINNYLYNKFPCTEERVYLGVDSLPDNVDMDNYPVEVLNSLEFGNLPAHTLKLKIGCPVMLLRNLDPKSGLCNGTRLICRAFGSSVIKVEITSGSHKGHMALIPRVKLSPTASTFPIPFLRKQFPITLSFASTINKAQGQTYSRVGIYLPSDVFSHGQLYVAMSRVGNPSALKFFFDKPFSPGETNYKTANVVYKEVYNRLEGR
ncbi:hypothetical protein [Absidia glauca]|uniref:DNA helicase Pif1-like 2B domain-containing protein n=1 Tax=Absidia glauca TaxID=4829 RepID=A0A168Q9X8_ABSGL|nr:hypothetical protein [Absidia glauca]